MTDITFQCVFVCSLANVLFGSEDGPGIVSIVCEGAVDSREESVNVPSS